MVPPCPLAPFPAATLLLPPLLPLLSAPEPAVLLPPVVVAVAVVVVVAVVVLLPIAPALIGFGLHVSNDVEEASSEAELGPPGVVGG